MSKKRAYWCDNCQIPLLGKDCCLCKKEGRDIGVADFRPIFKEELDFIKTNSGISLLKQSRNNVLWGMKRDYYYKGCKFAKVTPDSCNNKLLVSFYSSVNGNAKTKAKSRGSYIERLEKGNRAYLEQLQYNAIRIIREIVKKYPKKPATVSFSGGKDSVVTSYLVRKALSSGKVIHIFGDTTIETPDTYSFIEVFKSENPLLPFIVSKPSADFFELCKKIAPPSRIQRWCCTTHKAASLSKVINIINNSEGVISFSGIRKEESSSRSDYQYEMEGDKIANQTLVNPILDWSTLDVWLFTLTYGLPVNIGYKKGLVRIGCYPCPFNSSWWEFLGSCYYKEEFNKWYNVLLDYAYESNKYEPQNYVSKGIWKSRVGGLGLNNEKTKIRKEHCSQNVNKITYTLQKKWDKHLWDYIKPLGKIENIYEDEFISKKVLISQNGEVLAFFKALHPYGQLEVIIDKENNKHLFRHYIERQIRKFQTCVLCGACMSHCPNNAISLNCNYTIDDEKCCNCLECVKKMEKGCIAAHSLNYNENRCEVIN